jgi:hypothetical protein
MSRVEWRLNADLALAAVEYLNLSLKHPCWGK